MKNVYINEASTLFKNDKKYIGFSITAGHPTRQKEISLKQKNVLIVDDDIHSSYCLTELLESNDVLTPKNRNHLLRFKKNLKNQCISGINIEKLGLFEKIFGNH